MKLRRNDIVLVGNDKSYRFYGRINCVLSNDMYEVIYCGSNWGIVPINELEYTPEYSGYMDKGRRIRMPSLRKLKQAASRYDKRVWRRNRHMKGYSYDDN